MREIDTVRPPVGTDSCAQYDKDGSDFKAETPDSVLLLTLLR